MKTYVLKFRQTKPANERIAILANQNVFLDMQCVRQERTADMTGAYSAQITVDNPFLVEEFHA